MAGSLSSWRAEDLLDLERCGLAAELASTNLGPVGGENGWGQGTMGPEHEVDITYDYNDMSEVLDNLLNDKTDLPLLSSASRPMATPTHETLVLAESCAPVEVVLRAPSAYGIKTDQEKVTYLNRGQSYEIQLQHSAASPLFYSCTLSLSFCELRWRNNEREHFEQWKRDHPCDRLLEIDLSGCQGLRLVQNHDEASFTWGHSNTATVALKVNCLSSEFAAKKHGGERGVPLKLYLEMRRCKCDLDCGRGHSSECQVVYQAACGIKVFKDKGGDRKHKQDQSKIEKLSASEQAKYYPSESSTRFLPTQLSTSLPCTPFTSKSDNSSTVSYTPGASPYTLATPPTPPHHPANHTAHNSIASCTSVADTQTWLLLNRFGQYCSLFSNYTGTDLMCLSRQDMMDLCGHADGIRLYNSVHSRILKTLYVRFVQDDKVYQAVCLEELTAKELLMRLLDKLVWLDAKHVSSFLRLTAGGLLVRVDDAVVQGIQQEHHFLLETIKDEDGSYQVVLGDHTPPHHGLSLSFAGSTQRH